MSDTPKIETIVSELVAERAAGKTVVFVSGNFNIVHPGHLRLMKFAAEQADYLVVGLSPDSASGVSVPAPMRLEAL